MQVNVMTPNDAGVRSGGIFGALSTWIGGLNSSAARPSAAPSNAAVRAAEIRQDRLSAERARRQQTSADLYRTNNPIPKPPFDPKSYNWAAESAGSRPSGVDVEALRAARLGALDTSGLDDSPVEEKPKPPADDKPKDYSTEGSALSAEVFGALAERRRTVDEQLQRAIEQERFQTQRLQLAAQTARTQVAKEFRNLAEDLQMKLGGRGLATDPRFAGRGRRRLQMQESEKFGEISQTLADEISALQEMVQTVSDARDREMAKIAQDEALARTMPAALLPAALQYTSS